MSTLRKRFFSLFLVGLLTAASPCFSEEEPPFYLGVWVGADPVGWGDLPGTDTASSIQEICKDISENGMNAVWVSGFDGASAGRELIPVWLDTAAAHGLKVVLQGSGGPFAIQKGVDEETMQHHLVSEVVPTWRSIAEDYGSRPEILAYVPVEEIGDNVEAGETQTLSALKSLGDAVRQIDPAHPVITIHIAPWISVAETEAQLRGPHIGAVAADLYVFTYIHEWSDPATSWATSEEATQAFLDWTSRYTALGQSVNVPAWMMGQAFESTWTKKDQGEQANMRMPTAEEMRFQAWAAILGGAKGLFFFTYQSFQEPSEETKQGLEEWEVNKGMKTLEGESTTAHEGAMAIARRLAPHLTLLGRLKPNTDIKQIVPSFWVREFLDPADGTLYLILLNRNVSENALFPKPEQRGLGDFQDQPIVLGAGDGALFKIVGIGRDLEPVVYDPPV